MPTNLGSLLQACACNRAVKLGIVQVVCGVIALANGIVLVYTEDVLLIFGAGIWTGILFLLAGILRILSGNDDNNDACMSLFRIVLFLASIVASVILFGLSCILLVFTIKDNLPRRLLPPNIILMCVSVLDFIITIWACDCDSNSLQRCMGVQRPRRRILYVRAIQNPI